MKRSRWVIEESGQHGSGFVVIRDLGPWDRYLSVTNDAEAVVDDIVTSGRLCPGQRILYYDSDGQLDELLVEGGRFAGFAQGPRARGAADGE